MGFQSIQFGEVYEFNNPIVGPITKVIAVPPGAKWVTFQLVPEGSPSAITAHVYQSFDGVPANSYSVPPLSSTAVGGAVLTSTNPTTAPFLHLIAFSRTGGTNTKMLVTVVR